MALARLEARPRRRWAVALPAAALTTMGATLLATPLWISAEVEPALLLVIASPAIAGLAFASLGGQLLGRAGGWSASTLRVRLATLSFGLVATALVVLAYALAASLGAFPFFGRQIGEGYWRDAFVVEAWIIAGMAVGLFGLALTGVFYQAKRLLRTWQIGNAALGGATAALLADRAAGGDIGLAAGAIGVLWYFGLGVTWILLGLAAWPADSAGRSHRSPVGALIGPPR